jgi:hypothetical protein
MSIFATDKYFALLVLYITDLCGRAVIVDFALTAPNQDEYKTSGEPFSP